MRFPGSPSVFLCPSFTSNAGAVDDRLQALRNDTAARLIQERVNVVEAVGVSDTQDGWKHDMDAAFAMCDSCVQLLVAAPEGNIRQALAFDRLVAEQAKSAAENRKAIGHLLSRVV